MPVPVVVVVAAVARPSAPAAAALPHQLEGDALRNIEHPMRGGSPPPPPLPPMPNKANWGASAGPCDLTYLSRSGCVPPPPMESRRGGGAVGPHGERAHWRSAGRDRCAARSGEGDREHDGPRDRLPSGGRRPSPCRSYNRADAMPRAGGEPCGGTSGTPALSATGWAGCSHARSNCAAVQARAASIPWPSAPRCAHATQGGARCFAHTCTLREPAI